MDVLFYHGTSSRGYELARERGELRPADPLEIARSVAESVSLDPQALIGSTSFAFSRERASDNQIYLSAAQRVAAYYASVGSEILDDALHAAFRLIEQKREQEMEKLERRAFHTAYAEFSAQRRQFAADWRAAQGIEPVVLEVRLSLGQVECSSDYQRYFSEAQRRRGRQRGAELLGVADWLELSNPPTAPLNTLMCPFPIPLSQCHTIDQAAEPAQADLTGTEIPAVHSQEATSVRS